MQLARRLVAKHVDIVLPVLLENIQLKFIQDSMQEIEN